MNNGMTPPEGELIDASDFWDRRNKPASVAAEVADAAAGGADATHQQVPRHPFKRLLVANRGEIACRVFRTARDLGIETVAVFSEPDSSAAHVREADIAVAIGGVTSSESYLDTAKILEAARRVGRMRFIPGTASFRRIPTSRRPSSTQGSPGLDRRPNRSIDGAQG